MIPIKESEARELVCPFGRSASSMGNAHMCIGRYCMLWRRDEQSNKPEPVELPLQELKEHLVAPPPSPFLDPGDEARAHRAALVEAGKVLVTLKWPNRTDVWVRVLSGTAGKPMFAAWAMVPPTDQVGQCGVAAP